MTTPVATQTYPQICPSAGPGHSGNLTADMESNLKELRAQLSKAGYVDRVDDASLLRFLRARKFDVAAARKMFEECEAWRKGFGVDDIKKSFHFYEKPQISRYYPQYYHKTDKEGRPVYIEELGAINLKEMYKITTHERMLQNLVNEYEKFVDQRLPACSRMKGELVETSCTIMDLKGVGISSISSVYSYVKSASTIGQNYYPERMGKFYLINAPWGFSSAFSMIKGLLDEVTVKKIFILGSSYKTELLKQIPAANLPKKFGGSSDSNGGVELSDEGPWTDPKYSVLADGQISRGPIVHAVTTTASPLQGHTQAI